jgi:hypothetical protein
VDAGAAVLAYLREADGERLLVALNFAPQATALGAEAARVAAGGRIELSTSAAAGKAGAAAGGLVLGPDEGVVISLG